MFLCRRLALLVLAAIAFCAPAEARDLPVEVRIEGLEGTLARDIRRFSALARKKERVAALAPVRRAARLDAGTMVGALQSRGYYAARVEPFVDRAGQVVDVVFRVDPGPLFTIAEYRIVYLDEQDAARPETPGDVGITPNGRASGEALKAIETGIMEALWSDGYVTAVSAGHVVEADAARATARAVFRIETGPRARYGGIVVDGVERTDPVYVQQFRPFEIGAVASREELETYRKRLVETGLFNEIDVEPKLPREDGTTDILVRLAERPHRTLGGGVSFDTNVGPGVTAFWENRNLFHRGETLRADVAVSDPVQEGQLSFRKDRPRLPGYYTLSTLLRNNDTEAFNAQTLRIGGSLAKLAFDRRLTAEAGLRYQYSRSRECETIEEPDGDEICTGTIIDETFFQAVSVPLILLWNSQDDPLDPGSGFIAQVSAEPFFGTGDFTRFGVAYTDRVFFGRRDWGTLAWRARAGAIYGADRAAIPPPERFYAGGGGSIRGYGFQEASPIDPDSGAILGGASIAEASIELRHHVTEDIELAVFSDAGSAFEANTPDFDEVLVAAGAGIRYHSPIGPFRIDAAFPLDRRTINTPLGDFEDASFQIYIGLGQPF